MTKRIVSNGTPAHVVRFEAAIERKSPSLPRFIVVASELLEAWDLSGTSIVEVTVRGTALGRRTLKRWRERDGWFFDLTGSQCDRADLDTGDVVAVEVRRASTAPPRLLQTLIDDDLAARRAWDALTLSQRRMLSEHVRQAKRIQTRRRRARRGLGLDE